MFKRISIFLIVLLTILCFVGSASAVDAGLFVLKDSGNTYIDYVDADDTSIMTIDHLSGVYIAVLTTGTTSTTTSYTSMHITSTLDASSLTTASLYTDGGMAIAKQLYLGDHLDMSQTVASGTYEITLRTSIADALSIRDSAADMMVFDTSTPRVTIIPVTTITGALTATGGITVGAAFTVGAAGTGWDVKFHGDVDGSDFFWDEDGDSNESILSLGDTAGSKGVDFIVYGDTSTTYMKWDQSVDDLLLVGSVSRLIISGNVDTSLTDAAIVVTGGIAVTKVLWLGDDINMSTNGTGIYDIVLNDGVVDALSITDGSGDFMEFDTDNDEITFTPLLVLKAGIDMQTNTTGIYELTLKDTQVDALSIIGGSTHMMVFKTDTDQIIITPEVLFLDDLDLTTSTTGVYELTLNANQADALSIRDSSGDLMVFDTTSGILAITIPKAFVSMGTGPDDSEVGIVVTSGTHAFAVYTEPGTAHSEATSSFGIRSRYLIDTAQTNTVTFEAVDARLRVKQDLAGGVHVGVQGIIEASGSPAFAGGLNAAGSFTLELQTGTTITGGTYMVGVSIDSASHTDLVVTDTIYAALRISAGDGPPVKEDWEYGIIMDDGDVGIGIQIGDATTGINLDGAYTTGLNISGTLATATSRAIKSITTIDAGALDDGYGAVEFDLTITGTSTKGMAAMSSWLTINAGSHGPSSSNGIYAAQTNGIWQATGDISGAVLVFGLRMQAVVADSDAHRLVPFSLNVSGGDTMDAIWSADPANMAFSANSDDGEVGIIPFLIDANGHVWYIRLYDE